MPSTAVARRDEARSPRRRRGRWSVPLVLTAAAIAAAVGIGRLERSTRTETRADSVSVFTRAGEPAGSAAGGTDSATARAGGAPIERPDSAAARNRTGGQPSPSEPPAAPAPAAPPPARETTSPTAVPAAVPAPVPRSTVPPAASAPTRPRSHADSLARCRSPLFVDQRACLFASLADEDAELNRSYQRLIAELRRRDGGSEPESVRRLRAAQRDWLVRRDEACQRQNPGDDDGLWARARARCLGTQADRRAQELEAKRQRLAGG